MSDHPYKQLPDKAFWRRSVTALETSVVDPVGVFDLRLEPETKVATAGSCFAQHIARHLAKSGFNYYVTEPGHPIVPDVVRSNHNYGVYSARYGNIYTARQLLQLFQRAYDKFKPEEDVWSEPDGTFLDPFRPSVEPGGFVSVAELKADRRQHLAAVRKMFETLDVFVFTLGLTECWLSNVDGAVFPLCPGVEGGRFDPEKHVFYNQTAADVVADMSAFLDGLKAVNPACRVMLTVSPVPLMASASPGAHVLSATTYSKSVLRVAAETLRSNYDFVDYFPSYEIITGAYNRGRYFANDLRNVTEEGVSHVMRVFLAHATSHAAEQGAPREAVNAPPKDDFLQKMEAFVAVECDEVALDRAS
jgi:hypothetical protein